MKKILIFVLSLTIVACGTTYVPVNNKIPLPPKQAVMDLPEIESF